MPGVLASALAAKDAGIKEIIVPLGNGSEAALVDGLAVYEARTITEVCDHLAGRREIAAAARPEISSFAIPFALPIMCITLASFSATFLSLAARLIRILSWCEII